ncbi:MAG: hypothetical protein KAI43_13205 [Candidatus Aureabacteria bacterium]|nr:hypothetical protein [Candidatus Auribacterota bacterium]
MIEKVPYSFLFIILLICITLLLGIFKNIKKSSLSVKMLRISLALLILNLFFYFSVFTFYGGSAKSGKIVENTYYLGFKLGKGPIKYIETTFETYNKVVSIETVCFKVLLTSIFFIIIFLFASILQEMFSKSKPAPEEKEKTTFSKLVEIYLFKDGKIIMPVPEFFLLITFSLPLFLIIIRALVKGSIPAPILYFFLFSFVMSLVGYSVSKKFYEA